MKELPPDYFDHPTNWEFWEYSIPATQNGKPVEIVGHENVVTYWREHGIPADGEWFLVQDENGCVHNVHISKLGGV